MARRRRSMAPRRPPSFFMVLIEDDFCDQLTIPLAFHKHFDGKVPQQSLLRTPARAWKVNVKKVNDRLFFKKGWKKFVHGNGLKMSEFLVFHYAGNSEFDVEIFGTDSCKRGSAMGIGQSDRPLDEEGHGNGIHRKCPRSKHVGSSTRHGKHNIDDQGGTSAAGTRTRKATSPIKKEVVVIDSETSESEDASESEEAFDSETSESQTSMPRDQLGSRKNLSWEARGARALEAAKKYSSSIRYPSFISVLKTAYVHKGMLHIPKRFIDQMGRSVNVKVQVSEELWPIRCVHDQYATRLSAGWLNFVKHHDLKVGDVCVFELIGRDDVPVIKVSFYRC